MLSFFESFVGAVNDVLWSKVLIAVLIVLGLYFTFQTKFVQIRFVGEMLRLLGEGAKGSSKKPGSISSFQAFCISTASRVGTGNLAGVAMAISIGGPGAVFWMWLIALVGAASAFVESTLAQMFKVKDGAGFRGGPAYYMERGLNKRWMGVLFAILITLCFGLVFNAVQANTISQAFNTAYGFNQMVIGLILSVVTAFIIFGGVKRVATVAEFMVPVMAGAYVLVALFVVVTNITHLPAVLTLIVKSAFGLEQAVGGGMGAAMMWGIKRGLFSNEAGMGSAANAAATADVTHPVKQGLIQALGVFVDTLLVCSATAFIVLLSGQYKTEGLDGIALTQASLSYHVGAWASSFIAIIIFLFAFSSVIGNYYYGETNIEFIKSNKVWMTVYRLAVVGMVMFGSMAKISIVWDLADLFMALMALLNLTAIVLLGKYAFAALQDYTKQKKAGKDPVFTGKSIPGLPQVDCWQDEQEKQQKAG